MIKVLFLTSNPEGTPPLKLDEEAHLITQKIRASDYRDVLKLETLWAVRPDDLLQALNEHKPQIVHFSGHGSKTGEIVLMDDNRQVKPVSVEALKMLFSTLKDNIRVAVLNVCYSEIQAQAISEIIDCVVGMNTAIGDEAAIIFAASFYRAIGFGRSIKEAFDQGNTALMLEGIPEASTPQLLTRMGIDSSSIVLIEPDQNKSSIDAPKISQRINGNHNIFSATGDVILTVSTTGDVTVTSGKTDTLEDKLRRAKLHIKTRLKKIGGRASYDRIREDVNSDYGDEFIEKLIDLNPEIFGRCQIRLKDGSHKKGMTLVTIED